jgi:hypothetical protein
VHGPGGEVRGIARRLVGEGDWWEDGRVEMTVGYSLEQRAAIVRCRSQLQTLNSVDDLWTDYLRTADQDDVRAQREAVLGLTDSLLATLDDTATSLETLTGVLEATDAAEIDQAFDLIGQQHPQIVTNFDATFVEVLDEYDHRGMLIDACAYLREELPQERSLIEEKRARIAADEFEPGDMRPATKCAASVVLVATGVALVVMTTGAAALAVGAGHEVAGAVFAFDNGCAGYVKKIWSRLRH